MTLRNNDQEMMRQYLLGRLTDEEQQQIEERLLAEDDLFEELEIGQDELIEDYLSKQLSQEECAWVEENFLASPEGKQKHRFAKALNRYVLNQSRPQSQKRPSWNERLVAFWNRQPNLLRAATAFAAIVIVVGMFLITRPPAAQNFATLTLTNTSITRSGGTELPRIKLKEEGLRINLLLPAPATTGARYRVELLNEKGETRSSEVAAQDPKVVSIEIPPRQLTPGQYVITLSTIAPNGTVQRIPGGYQFITE